MREGAEKDAEKGGERGSRSIWGENAREGVVVRRGGEKGKGIEREGRMGDGRGRW